MGKKGLNRNLVFTVAACVLGSAFQHGYNTGVVNAPQKLIEDFINDTNVQRTGESMETSTIEMVFSLAVSMYCIGGLIGGLLTGTIADRFGRKGGLLLNNAFVVVAALLMGLSKVTKSYEMLIAGRFVIGINNGLNAGLAPMYLNEISPGNLRGAIGTSYQLVVTISILISQILGLPQLFGTSNLWPVLLAFTIIPTIFQLATLPMCPESPKYLLINKGSEPKAQAALTWLRGQVDHEEMDSFKTEDEGDTGETVTLKQMFTKPALRLPLIVSVVMMLSQQLSGINAVFYFSTVIFESAGLSKDMALAGTLLTGGINVLMTIVSLVLVERAGRKSLHMTGLGGMCIITILLTICLNLKSVGTVFSYLSVIFVIGFVVMFATGPGSIPWFLVSELFSTNSRSLATSMSVGVNWFANFLVGLLFLPLKNVMGDYVFLIFTVLLAIFFVFTWKKVPETKNKTPAEVEEFFIPKKYATSASSHASTNGSQHQERL